MNNFHQNYKTICIIGQGSYGRVEKAMNLNNQFVAIKHIKFQQGFQGVPSTALREMSNLKILNDHPNLIKLKDIIYKYKQKSLKLVFDYYHYNLKQFLELRDHSIPQTNIKMMIRQILSGIDFCHKRKIIHRDLKPQNILVDIEGNIKIADFGLSRVYNLKDNDLTPKIQTLHYRAPQILLGSSNYSYSVDIWTVGCIFAQLFIGKPIFNGNSQIQQIFSIFEILGTPRLEEWQDSKDLPNFKAKFPKWKGKALSQIIPNMPQIAISLLQKMISINPSKRISAFEALQHDYLKQTDTISSVSTELSDVET